MGVKPFSSGGLALAMFSGLPTTLLGRRLEDPLCTCSVGGLLPRGSQWKEQCGG